MAKDDKDGGDWFVGWNGTPRTTAIAEALVRHERKIGELEQSDLEKKIALKIIAEEKRVAGQFEKCLYDYCEHRSLNSDFQKAAKKSLKRLEASMSGSSSKFIAEKRSCLRQELDAFKKRVEQRQDKIEMEAEIRSEASRLRRIFDQSNYFSQASVIADIDEAERESMKHLEEKMTRKGMPLEEIDRNRKKFAEEIRVTRECASKRVQQQQNTVLKGVGYFTGYTGIAPLYSSISNYLWPKDPSAPSEPRFDQTKRESTWDLLARGSNNFGKAAQNIWDDWKPWR